MCRSIVRSIYFKIVLLLYLGVMLVFYPISRMYVDEYVTVPIQLEFAFFMVLVAFVSNSGIFFILSERGIKHKKMTCFFLVITTLMNAFLLLTTNGNPLHSISYECWNTVRYLCSYGVLFMGVVLCLIAWGHPR